MRSTRLRLVCLPRRAAINRTCRCGTDPGWLPEQRNSLAVASAARCDELLFFLETMPSSSRGHGDGGGLRARRRRQLRSGRDPSGHGGQSATSTSSRSPSSMSQKKQNLLARRIEMRRRKEGHMLRELQARLHVETEYCGDDGPDEEHEYDEIYEHRHSSEAPQHAHQYEVQIRERHDSTMKERMVYNNQVPTQQFRDYTLSDDAVLSRGRLGTDRESGKLSPRKSYVARNLTYNRDAVHQSGIMRSPNQARGNIGRTISQYSSPSDEWHGYSGRRDQLAGNQSNFESLRYNLVDEISESRSGSAGRQRTAQSIRETLQEPDWKELNDAHQDMNRRRLHRRQVTRNQPQNQQAVMPQRSHRPVAFSPVEHLSSRTDQIKRRSILPTSAPADKFPSYATQQDEPEGEGDESIVSVTDRARKMEQTNANNRRANFAMRRRRSRSLSRERSFSQSKPSRPVVQNQKKYPAYPARQHAQAHQDRFVDEETVSVASICKEWENKSSDKSSTRQGAHQLNSRSAFGAWEEREGRASRQRRRDQRRAQQRRIEDRWRRSASTSLPPPERRANRETPRAQRRNESFRSVVHQDGYLSEGHAREPNVQYEYVEVDSSAMTLQDARNRLWDQQERLRAVLPRDDVDHSDDVLDHIDYAQDHRTHMTSASDVVSPSNFSESSGGRFKSKFVHAAAVAASYRPRDVDRVPQQQARQVEKQRHVPQRRSSRSRSPKKFRPRPPKEVAVSCQYTDSTTDTTATTAPHSSFNSSRQGVAVRTSSSGGVDLQSSVKSNIQTGSMPSISETSQARSVAELIAKINAVSRSDPAQALAAIDSIIQREKMTVSSDELREILAKENPKAVSDAVPLERSRPPADIGPIKSQVSGSGEAEGEYFQEKYEEIITNLRRAELGIDDDPGLGEEGDDSGSWSSGETTVSSMTNPTYQSLHDADSMKRSRKQATSVKQTKSWNTIKNEYAARKTRFTDQERKVVDDRHRQIETEAHGRGSETSKSGKITSAPSQFAGMPELITPPSLSFGELDQSASEPEELMRVVSSAFSDVDIPLEEGGSGGNGASLLSIAARPQEGLWEADKTASCNVASNRRQELEFLAKSWTADNYEKDEQPRSADQSKNSVSGSADKKSILSRAKVRKIPPQPAIRLKGNQSLAKKFANLASAFQ